MSFDTIHERIYELQFGDYQDRMAFHLMLGLACGFPLCCILWFVGTYDFDRKSTITALEGWHWESKKGRRNNKSYALCPTCVIKERHK